MLGAAAEAELREERAAEAQVLRNGSPVVAIAPDVEDGTVTVELIRLDMRVGFVFDAFGDSSWFAVAKAGGSDSGGFVKAADLERLRDWLVELRGA